jgi:hypothetical protein
MSLLLFGPWGRKERDILIMPGKSTLALVVQEEGTSTHCTNSA